MRAQQDPVHTAIQISELKLTCVKLIIAIICLITSGKSLFSQQKNTSEEETVS